MATTIDPILHSDTPYSKTFLLLGGGAPGGEGLFSIDNFAVALHAGPLRDTLLRASPLSIHLFNLNYNRGNEIRLYEVAASMTDATYPRAATCVLYWKSGATTALAGLACELPAGEGNGYKVIEIRLNHSTQG